MLNVDVQTLQREKIDQYRLKLLLIHRYKVEVSKLMMSTGSSGERPHTTGCAIEYEL